MKTIVIVVFAAVFLCAQCKPVDIENEIAVANNVEHKLVKRFINQQLTSGQFSAAEISKIRAKRSIEEECEKLQLCKLHARSSRNFLAAFELYFVNKENARLWDHRAHSIGDCERRFSCYR